MAWAVDEKESVVDLVAVTKFLEKPLRESDCSRRIKPAVVIFVRLGIDSSVQPVLLAVDPNYCFNNSDLIRAGVSCRQ
jgi:hypothetical protein